MIQHVLQKIKCRSRSRTGLLIVAFFIVTEMCKLAEGSLEALVQPSFTPAAAQVVSPRGSPNAGFVEQPLDHNIPLSPSWKQRYFWNSSNYVPGGPIFIWLSSPLPGPGGGLKEGTMMDLCGEVRCFIYELEHRFQGESWPILDSKVESLRYLNAEQSTRDIVHFASVIKSQADFQNSKIMVIGRGKHTGALAAFSRIFYPFVIDIAWASNGGFEWPYEYAEYFQETGRVIRQVSRKCYDVIQKGFETLEKLVSTGEGCRRDGSAGSPRPESRSSASSTTCPAIQETFKLCQTLDITNQDDISNLFRVLAEMYGIFVQYNTQLGHKYNIDSWCTNIFTSSAHKRKTPLQKIAMFADLYNQQKNFSCTDFTFASFCNQMNEPNPNPGKSTAKQWWWWLTCSEIASFQSSSSSHQPFGHRFPTPTFVKKCQCAFTPSFTEAYIRNFVQVYKNERVGGASVVGHRSSQIVFVNGLDSPWSLAGVVFANQTGPGNKLVNIQGGSHGVDLRVASPADSPQLKAARLEIKSQIKTWLRNETPLC